MNVFVADDLILMPLPNGHKWMVMQDWHVLIDGKPYIVPAGLLTDFTSIGYRIFSPVVPRWGKHGFGAVLHDYLYQTRSVSRKEADYAMNEMMKHYKTKTPLRLIIYWGLRLGGWYWYHFRPYK